jgi:hypothetical protein
MLFRTRATERKSTLRLFVIVIVLLVLFLLVVSSQLWRQFTHRSIGLLQVAQQASVHQDRQVTAAVIKLGMREETIQREVNRSSTRYDAEFTSHAEASPVALHTLAIRYIDELRDETTKLGQLLQGTDHDDWRVTGLSSPGYAVEQIVVHKMQLQYQWTQFRENQLSAESMVDAIRIAIEGAVSESWQAHLQVQGYHIESIERAWDGQTSRQLSDDSEEQLYQQCRQRYLDITATILARRERYVVAASQWNQHFRGGRHAEFVLTHFQRFDSDAGALYYFCYAAGSPDRLALSGLKQRSANLYDLGVNWFRFYPEIVRNPVACTTD